MCLPIKVYYDSLVHNNPPIQTFNAFGSFAMHTMRTRILPRHWVRQLVPLRLYVISFMLV